VKPQLSFVAYPVSNISVSRRFYDTVLTVEPHAMSDDWIEYDLGDSTFVITRADAEHGTPVRVRWSPLKLPTSKRRLLGCVASRSHFAAISWKRPFAGSS
jgi:extradiol dioxygenase family protein